GIRAGLDFGGANLKVVVKLVAGLGLGSASAPDFTVEGDEPGFLGRLRARSAANTRGCINGRQFMVFLQKDDHAVGQLNALGFLRMERWQLWDGNFLPVLGLRFADCAQKGSG